MQGEDGASLLIALGFLMLFALLIPAIIGLGGTNFLGTTKLHTQRATNYAADGALDGAIQYMRQSGNLSCGRLNTTCTFNVTIGNVPTQVTMTGTGGIFDLDRTVNLVVKRTSDSQTIATGTVFIRDSSTTAPPPVYVTNWRYLR
jgi:hypothetical protein